MRFYCIIFLFLSSNCFAQQKTIALNRATDDISVTSYSNAFIVKPELQNSNLILAWPVATTDVSSNWEVQGSENGKDFKTIGLVWGTEAKSNTCRFKEQIGKLPAKFSEYRVIKYQDRITKN